MAVEIPDGQNLLWHSMAQC